VSKVFEKKTLNHSNNSLKLILLIVQVYETRNADELINNERQLTAS